MLSELIAFLMGGGVFSAALSWKYRVRHRNRLAADEQRYRKCWEEAITLLHEQGRLTDEQLAQLMPPSRPFGAARRMALALADVSEQQTQLYGMKSADRRDIEVRRAEEGLDPVDDLKGMTSEDIAAVRKARIQHGTEE